MFNSGKSRSSRNSLPDSRRWWWLLCLTLVLLIPVWIQASSNAPAGLIVQQAFWEDPGGAADLTRAQSQTYMPYRGLFSRGFSASAHWIRLELAPSTTRIVLIIKPVWLDSVTLYDPGGSPSQITQGDLHANSSNVWPGLGYAFELPPSAQQRTAWLRLKTSSSHVLAVQALPMDQALMASAQDILWGALYTSVQALILLLLAFMWWSQRDQLLGLYLVRHTAFTAYAAAYLGLPKLLFSDALTPFYMSHLFSFLAVCIVPLSLQFDVAFLRIYHAHRDWLRLLKLISWIGVVLLVILMFGFTQLALQMNVWLVMAAVPVTLMAVLSTKSFQNVAVFPPRKVMLAYYMVVINSLTIGLVSLLGKVESQAWALYGLIFHGLVTGLMMSVMLLTRSQRLAKHHQLVSWELRKTQQDMVLGQRRREEQSHFLHMLMHELKTPLSIVSMAIGTRGNREENLEHARRAVRDMKAIIERCVQADQVGELTLQQHYECCDLPALIRQSAQDVPHLAERMQLKVPSEVPSLHADRQLVKIVLTNLLSNAERYSDEHAPIAVHVTPEDRLLQPGLRVRVVNTPGVAGWPDERMIFDKYYRANGAQRLSGSGLGLYLSQQLTLSLGGTLEYAPSEHYVEFVLWIPLALA